MRLSSRRARLVAIGAAFLALTASSWIEVPMVPVPMTMQTLAVLLVGALFGWRLGAAVILVWLTAGAFGLPVFAGGAGGIAHLVGPTGGYLAGFLLAAMLTGYLAERGWNAWRPAHAFLAMLLAHVVCLGLGGAWLAFWMGPEPALAKGVVPFLAGAVVKSALAVAILRALASFHRA